MLRGEPCWARHPGPLKSWGPGQAGGLPRSSEPGRTTSRLPGILLASEAWSRGTDDAESWPQARPCLGVSNRTGRKRTSDSDRPPLTLIKQTIGVHLSHCWRPSHGRCRPRVLWPSAFPARAGPSAALHKHTQCIIYPATSLPGMQAVGTTWRLHEPSGRVPRWPCPQQPCPLSWWEKRPARVCHTCC